MAEVTELKSSETPPPPPPPTRNKGGRPPGSKDQPRPGERKAPEFFAHVESVPKEDWGKRAYMYVYVTEPVCNPKTWGETRYLLKSSAPIFDLEGLKQDYGSFKGFMTLNLRKTGKDATDEMDRLEFEIFDPKAPPKIPKGAWANDPRNKKWLDLLPPEPPSPNAAASAITEAMKIVTDIRRDVRSEIGEPEEPTSRASEVIETMRAAKDLFAPATAAAAPASDPFDLAAKIMSMRSNDPMTAVLMQMLESANKKEEAAREREFKLQQQLIEAKNGAPAGDWIDRLLSLAAQTEKIEGVKKLLGALFGGAGESTGRTVRTTAFDVVREVANSQFGSNLGNGLAVLLSNIASAGQRQPPPPVQAPIVLNQQQTDGTAPAENITERLNRIGQTITQPMLYEYFLKDAGGDEWAERMFDLWPTDYVFCKKLGADELVKRYRQFPPAWSVIAPKEEEFKQFITEFCAWDPNAEEANEGVTDLEEETGN